MQDVLLVHLPGSSDGDGGFRVDRFVSPPSRVFFSRFGSLEDLPTQEHGRHHQSSGPPRLHGRVVVRRQRRRRRMQSTDDQSFPFHRSFETNTSGNPPFPSRTTIHGRKEEEDTPRIHPKKRNKRATTNKIISVDGNVHPMHVLARNEGKAMERQQQQRRRGRIATLEDSRLDARGCNPNATASRRAVEHVENKNQTRGRRHPTPMQKCKPTKGFSSLAR